MSVEVRRVPADWVHPTRIMSEFPGEPRTIWAWVEWEGESPNREDFMPEWPEAECTHWQMYETTSEGTPISPVMATPEELARWLGETEAGAVGGVGASYEAWLATIQSGSAPSAMFQEGGRIESGVQFLARRSPSDGGGG